MDLYTPTPHRTYQILAPLDSHWRAATCAETDCDAYAYGWRTTLDETTRLGHNQAAYLRADTRHHTETRDDAGLTVFTYPPGQPCFLADDHRVPLDRPEILRVVTGYGTQLDGALDLRPADWVEDFADHVDQITAIRDAG